MTYEERVQKYERAGMTRSDAQGVVDAENLKRNLTRRERHQAMLDLGLVRVRGALGGVYYE